MGEAARKRIGTHFRSEDTVRKTLALYEEIMLAIAEDLPIWYSGHTATMIGTSPAVQGLNGWHVPGGELGIGFPAAEGRYHEVWLAS